MAPIKDEQTWINRAKKSFPWGTQFANREYLEFGYFGAEGDLVRRYLTTPSRVLVIGSGNGREALPIARDGHRIVCTDLWGIYLRVGQRMFAERGLTSTTFAQADMADLPFPAETFDFLFFTLYSYGGKRRHALLCEMHRVLRPAGLMVLTCWTPRYYHPKKKLPADAVYYPNEQTLLDDIAAAPCRFEVLETAVDEEHPRYRVAMLRKRDA